MANLAELIEERKGLVLRRSILQSEVVSLDVRIKSIDELIKKNIDEGLRERRQ